MRASAALGGIYKPVGRIAIEKRHARRIFGSRKPLEAIRDWMERRTRHFGRPYARLAGGWVGDLVDLKKVVLLCPLCTQKFDHRRNGYYRDWRFPHMTNSECDGCRERVANATMFFHESVLGTRSGCVLTPR